MEIGAEGCEEGWMEDKVSAASWIEPYCRISRQVKEVVVS